MPAVVIEPPRSFISQHNELDMLEKRLNELRTRQQNNQEVGTISASTGRINEADLRSVIDLAAEDDLDFEQRFEAFAEHAEDMRSRGWIGR